MGFFTVRCVWTRAAAVGLALAVLAGVMPVLPASAHPHHSFTQFADPPSLAPPPPSAPPPASVVLRVGTAVVAERADSATAIAVSASFPEGTAALDVPVSVLVSVGAEGDSADGAGVDYASVDDFAVVIPAGETGSTAPAGFVLIVADDDLAEGFERLTVSGSTEASGITEVKATEVAIVDDDGNIVLSADASSNRVDEGQSAAVAVQAALPTGITAQRDVAVRVSVGSEDDLATGAGVDYEDADDFTVVIPAGSARASADFQFAAAEDDLAEGDEAVTLSGTAGEGFSVTATSVTIADADATISLRVDADPSPEVVSSQVGEGETAQVEVAASLPVGVTAERPVALSVTVGAAGDSASAADYAAVDSFQVAIPAGANGGFGSFQLAAADDRQDGEGDETITVVGQAAAPGFTVERASVTIADRNPPPVPPSGNQPAKEPTTFAEGTVAQTPPVLPAPTEVILTADVTSAAEGGTASTVKVTASFPSGTGTLAAATTVSVTVGKAGDTATGSSDGAGADYTDVSGFDLEIATGQSTVTATTGFTLTLTDDMLAEGDETLTITGSTTAAGITEVREATITITDAADSAITLTADTDPGQDQSVTLAEPTVNAPGGSTVSVSGSLPTGVTAARELEITFGLGADGDTSQGSATGAAADYQNTLTATAAIAAGAGDFPAQDLTLQVTNDDVAWEGDESLSITGEATPAGVGVNPAVIYISDGDQPDVSLSVSPSSVGEGDGSPSLTVTAALPGSLTAAAEATFSVTVGKAGDTAVGSADGTSADYTNLSAAEEVKIAAGASSGSKAFNLTLIDDSDVEGPETASLTASGSVSVPNFDGDALGATNQSITVSDASFTIVDNDDLITLTVDTSSDSGIQTSVGEADGTVNITVEAALPTGATAPMGGLTVRVTVGKTGDTATGSADGTEADYQDIAAFDLTIASGQNSASATKDLVITQDDLAEGPETITFTPAAPSNYRSSDVAVIIDDDDNEITLSAEPSSVMEKGGSARVVVSAALVAGKTAASDLTITVTVGKDGDTATGALNGVGADYATAEDFEVEIDQGESTGEGGFLLSITDDPDYEGTDEEITLVPALAGFTINEVTITITGDNDLNPAGCGDGTYVDNHATQTGLVSDCRALINIRNHWVSTSLNYNWESTHPVLNWGKGSSAKITTWEGVAVTDTDSGTPVVSRVTKLEMLDETVLYLNPDDTRTLITQDLQRPGWGVSGFLPSALGDLTALEELLLNNNLLIGSIPTQLGSLVNLQKLYLHGNLLTGTLPTQLSSLTNLTEMLLSHNLLNGAIPASFGSLTNLTKLWLDDNTLSGNIPTQLGSLTNLEELILSDNYKTTFNTLLRRNVRTGGLSGAVPDELGDLTSLVKLRLDDNVLTGSIPSDLGDLSNLEELWLEDNLLSGTIPSELGDLSNLEDLDLSLNQLSGAVPSSLGNLANLEYLTLGNNQLTSLPAEIGDLDNLEALVLRHNRFSSLPAELAQLVPRWVYDANQDAYINQGGALKYLYVHNLGTSAPIPERLLDVAWVDLFAFDDPLDLIAFYDFSKGLATTPREYEIWTCDVGDDFDITAQQATANLSDGFSGTPNTGVSDFFHDMSDGKFSLTFSEGRNLISNPTREDGGLAAARRSCLDRIRPDRRKQVQYIQYRDTERKVIIIDSNPTTGALNNFYTRLELNLDASKEPVPGYQELSVDNIIHVGGGTVPGTGDPTADSQLSRPSPNRRVSTVAHEIGHGLQWPHSFGGRIFLGGEVWEYDNRMDLMSGRDSWFLTTGTLAINRYASGWIEPEDVAVHTGGQAEYVLSPQGEDGLQMLVIPTTFSVGTFFTLGVRVQEGVDSDLPVEGVELYLIDQRHTACEDSFAGLCANTSRTTIPVNTPSIDAVTRRFTIENVFDERNNGEDGLGLHVGALTEEGDPDRVPVEIVSRQGDKFTVRVGALPFEPARSRTVLGLPEDITVSATADGSNTVREGDSRRVTITAAYPSGSRTSRIPARVSLSVSGTAASGSDFAQLDDFALVIPAGESTVTGSFTLRTINDSRQESQETISIAFRAPGYDLSGDPLSFTIPANDQPPPPPPPPPPSPPSTSGGGSSSPPAAPPSAPPAPVQPVVVAAEPAYEGRFSDEDGSVHQSNIEQIAEWRITVGCSAEDAALFCPRAQITRRQMAAFLFRAVEHRWGTPPSPARQELADVGDDVWFRLYADWSVANGVMETRDGMFNPAGVVTRSDMARMLVAAFPHLNAAEESEGLFSDVQGSDEESILAMEGLFAAGVTRGCATDPLRFCPHYPVTRAQMASFFVRALNSAPTIP